MAARGYLFDVNVWLALALAHHPFHAQAAAAFLAASPERRAHFCWATRLAVLRLLTTASVFKPAGLLPLTNKQALAVLDGWTASPVVASVVEQASVWTRWRTYADLPTASPKRWMDAYLAAVSLEHGLQFVTTDGAFASYAGLDAVILVDAATATTPLESAPPRVAPSTGEGGGSGPA